MGVCYYPARGVADVGLPCAHTRCALNRSRRPVTWRRVVAARVLSETGTAGRSGAQHDPGRRGVSGGGRARGRGTSGCWRAGDADKRGGSRRARTHDQELQSAHATGNDSRDFYGARPRSTVRRVASPSEAGATCNPRAAAQGAARQVGSAPPWRPPGHDLVPYMIHDQPRFFPGAEHAAPAAPRAYSTDRAVTPHERADD